jgi:ribosomal protein S28E/S33
VPKDGYTTGTMFIILDNKEMTGRKTKIKIGVYEGDKKIYTINTSFLGPFNGN